MGGKRKGEGDECTSRSPLFQSFHLHNFGFFSSQFSPFFVTQRTEWMSRQPSFFFWFFDPLFSFVTLNSLTVFLAETIHCVLHNILILFLLFRTDPEKDRETEAMRWIQAWIAGRCLVVRKWLSAAREKTLHPILISFSLLISFHLLWRRRKNQLTERERMKKGRITTRELLCVFAVQSFQSLSLSFFPLSGILLLYPWNWLCSVHIHRIPKTVLGQRKNSVSHLSLSLSSNTPFLSLSLI